MKNDFYTFSKTVHSPAGLFKNVNAQSVTDKEKEKRDKMKEENDQRKQQIKEAKEKQKQKAEDRKEKEKKKTQKGERRARWHWRVNWIITGISWSNP